jgi:putative (di)nucleoside polyphosphate hydrolase
LEIIARIQPAHNTDHEQHQQKNTTMIDPDGFRPNVAMVIINNDSQVFWAQRSHNDGWQFPQGGMNSDETPVEAMYRELYEETGLYSEHVRMLGSTPGWLRYQLPHRFQRANSKPLCIGQKQVWFLLRLLDDNVQFNFKTTREPEFRDFRWVDFWYPADNVIRFKRRVYRQALTLLEPMIVSA